MLSVFVFRCCLCVVCSEKEAFSLVALNPGGCCGIQPQRVVDHETAGARDVVSAVHLGTARPRGGLSDAIHAVKGAAKEN